MGRGAWKEMIISPETMNSNSTWRNHVILHELGHVLGMHHEHQRSDRDNFVTLRPENDIMRELGFSKGQYRTNFGILDRSKNYGPYDYDSVMHYSSYWFESDNSSLIHAGNRGAATLSAGDVATVRALYP